MCDNRHDPRTGLFAPVFGNRAPRQGLVRLTGLRQPPVPGHVPHGQVLDHDRVEAAGQHVAGLLEHRLPLVGHPQVKPRNLLPGDPMTVAPFPLPGQAALKAFQPPERRLQLPVRGKVKVLAGL